jgi:hypothetical protein
MGENDDETPKALFVFKYSNYMQEDEVVEKKGGEKKNKEKKNNYVKEKEEIMGGGKIKTRITIIFIIAILPIITLTPTQPPQFITT